MKLSEKLDGILKYLYEKRFDGEYYFIHNIVESLNFETIGIREPVELAKRLQEDNYANTRVLAGGHCQIKINTYGVEYCEQSSYTNSSVSLTSPIYNLIITDSPNANIINNSTATSISIDNSSIQATINKLKNSLKDIEGNENRKNSILECLKEIEASLKEGHRPKFAYKALLEEGSNIAGITSLILQLGQLIWNVV